MNNTLITVMNDKENGSTAYLTPLSTKREKLEMFNASTSATRLRDMINKEIRVKNISITPVDYTDEETGEITTHPKTVIVDYDGNCYASSSIGVYRSVVNIYQNFPEDFSNGNITVAVKEKTTRNGFTTLVLDIADIVE